MDANETRTEDTGTESFGPFEEVGPRDVLQALEANRRELQRQGEEIARLQALLARGTGDVTEKAEAAVKEAKPKPAPVLTLVQKIEQALRQRVLATDELAAALDVPAAKIFAAIKEVRPKVHNLGTPERARWSWRPGDEAGTPELRALVERLISDTPMSFRDIIMATGARDGRIQGILVEIRRAHPGQVHDLGVPGKARWFMLPPGARDATLKPRRK